MFVPKDRRPRNIGPKCVWCATETIFWGAAGLEEFKGLRDRSVKGWSGGADRQNIISYIQDWTKEGRAEGVKLKQGKSYAFFKEACDSGTGAVFFIPGHALALVGIDEESARVIDNNGPPVVQVWSRRKFDGMAEWGCCPDLPDFLKQPRPSPYNPRPSPNHPPLNPDRPKPPTPKPDEPKPEPPAPTVDIDKLAELIIAKLPKPVPGKDGATGPQGPAGERGPKGLDGQAGPAGPSAVIDYKLIAAEVVKVLPDHTIEINNLQQQITVLRNQINLPQQPSQTTLYRERIVPEK